MNRMVTILMCTYNGHKYIKEQLESIINQTYRPIELIIYDDLSTDNTVNIIKSIREKTDINISCIVNSIPSGSAKSNFCRILKDYIDKEYIMFSDQDDIWDSRKVEVMMKKMIELEEKEKAPYLVCHNCKIVDAACNVTGHRIIQKVEFGSLITNPQIQGNSMLVNAQLLKKLSIDDKYICMHDWYLSLVCSLIGKICVLDDELLNYRQHGNNVAGYEKTSLAKRIRLVLNQNDKIDVYNDILMQLLYISAHYDVKCLKAFQSYYKQKEFNKAIKELKGIGAIDLGLHGVYQELCLKKAMKRQKSSI